ncbi:hypothetical protein DFP72DRAFT_854160 [Ephemerocybe angulata]|uniref:Uncharacterized protein n=1 Tax=Ephemerocybe angulata TaxID=980116 RepID=A0A8H6LYP7_9AGAR|nr:hypothetical protein DFP72DRAFT_854160 [Tulosesus angulatus]
MRSNEVDDMRSLFNSFPVVPKERPHNGQGANLGVDLQKARKASCESSRKYYWAHIKEQREKGRLKMRDWRKKQSLLKLAAEEANSLPPPKGSGLSALVNYPSDSEDDAHPITPTPRPKRAERRKAQPSESASTAVPVGPSSHRRRLKQRHESRPQMTPLERAQKLLDSVLSSR